MPSAQVVLKASALDRADWVMQRFAEAGCKVGAFVGVSFSIEAPVEQFESYFRIAAQSSGPRPFSGYQLPLEHLDPELRAIVQMVIFTPPPDFGPGASY